MTAQRLNLDGTKMNVCRLKFVQNLPIVLFVYLIAFLLIGSVSGNRRVLNLFFELTHTTLHRGFAAPTLPSRLSRQLAVYLES